MRKLGLLNNALMKEIGILELTCSHQRDELNKYAKGKINDDEASALAFRNMQAESNRKLHQLMRRIGQLEADNSVAHSK